MSRSFVPRTALSRAGVLAALVLAQAVALPGAATADDFSVGATDGILVIRTVARQANQMTISLEGDVLTVKDVVVLTAGPGCKPVGDLVLRCDAKSVTRLDVALGDGDDTFVHTGAFPAAVNGGDGDDVLTGSAAGDKLTGGAGDDVLVGNYGKDLLVGGLGADQLHGGADADTLYGDLSVASPGCLSLPVPGCRDLLSGGGGDDVLHGGEWGDDYRGDDGDDLLDDPATSGGNRFDGGKGDDVIDGASEVMRDTIVYSGRWNPVVVDLVAGTGGEAGEHDLIANIQDVLGGSGDDELNGNARANRIDGGAGHDKIDGGGGADVCVGEQVSC